MPQLKGQTTGTGPALNARETTRSPGSRREVERETMPEGIITMEPATPGRPLSAPVRYALRGLGIVSTILGAVGVVLPGVPTTPFLLIAAAAFARSSPRLHQRLLANRVFGPMIRDWETSRTISNRAKLSAVASIVLLGGTTLVFLVPSQPARLGLGTIMGAVIVWLISRPSRR